MSNKWPIVSIAIGGALIGGSLLLKYLVKDEDIWEKQLDNGEEYIDGFSEGILNFKYDHDESKIIGTSKFSCGDTDGDIKSSLPPYIPYNEDKPSIDELIEEYAYMSDDVEDEEEEESFDSEEEIDDELKEIPPFIISVDSFMNDYLSFSKNTITYFEKDNVLADDRDEVIVDYLNYIGEDALDSFGEGSDDPNLVYVRNFSKEADYEIVKDPTAYQETVLGFDDPDDKASKYFNLNAREE